MSADLDVADHYGTTKERKLYVVTRRDLPPAVRAVMALHAVADYVWCKLHSVPAEQWTQHGPPILFMTVRDRQRLEVLADREDAHTYSDPDLNEGVCAITLYREQWNDNWARIAMFAEATEGERQ